MFDGTKLYKHDNCLDIALKVLQLRHVKPKKVWKAKVEWYNISSGTPVKMDLEEDIVIKEKDMKKWKEFK